MTLHANDNGPAPLTDRVEAIAMAPLHFARAAEDPDLATSTEAAMRAIAETDPVPQLRRKARRILETRALPPFITEALGLDDPDAQGFDDRTPCEIQPFAEA